MSKVSYYIPYREGIIQTLNKKFKGLLEQLAHEYLSTLVTNMIFREQLTATHGFTTSFWKESTGCGWMRSVFILKGSHFMLGENRVSDRKRRTLTASSGHGV